MLAAGTVPLPRHSGQHGVGVVLFKPKAALGRLRSADRHTHGAPDEEADRPGATADQRHTQGAA